MFENRFGIYLMGLSIFVGLIGMYGGMKNTLFRKENTRLKIMGGIVIFVLLTIYADYLIFDYPPAYNRREKIINGKVIEYKCISTSWKSNLVTLSIKLIEDQTKEIYSFPDITGIDNLKRGSEIEIHFYEFTGALNRVITKVDGKELNYVKRDYPVNKTFEKLFAIGILSIQAVVMCYLARLEYVDGGRKKRGKKWCIVTCITAGIYGLFPWITYAMTDKSKEIGIGLSVIFTLYMIERYILAWQANIDEHLNEWQAIPLNEIQIKEEKKQRKAEEKRQFRKEMEEWERKENEKIEKKQSAIEMDRAKEHQFQQMNYSMTQRYCNLKFRCCMKNSVINAAGMGLALVFVTVIVLAFSSDKVFACFGYIVGVSVILALLIIGMGCIRGYHKNKKFKEIPASGKLLEYATVVVEIGKEKRFLCSDGHEEVWRMEYDDDAEVKEGQEAVVIYVPSTGEMITEKPDILHKIFEG